MITPIRSEGWPKATWAWSPMLVLAVVMIAGAQVALAAPHGALPGDFEHQMADIRRRTQLVEAAFLFVFLVGPVILGWALGRGTRWPRWRSILLAPLPAPGLIGVVCIYLFVTAFRGTPEQCGVDACGMMMMAAMFIFGVAVVAYLVGVALAWAGFQFGRRARPRLDIPDIFS